MKITNVKITPVGPGDRDGLLAYCLLTFDDVFVVHDVRIVMVRGRIIVSMPDRKRTDRCPECDEKNHIQARYCNRCGGKLIPQPLQDGEGNRIRFLVDIAHPICPEFRAEIERAVTSAYREARPAATHALP